MKTHFSYLLILALVLQILFLYACTPAQQQKIAATQANINTTAAAIQANVDKAAPVVQADIVKATPAINTAVDIGLTVTGKGAFVPLNDTAAAIIERGQAAATPKPIPPATAIDSPSAPTTGP